MLCTLLTPTWLPLMTAPLCSQPVIHVQLIMKQEIFSQFCTLRLRKYCCGNICDRGYVQAVVPLLHAVPPNECNRSREQNKKTFAYSTNHGGVKSEIVGALTDSGDLSARGPSISFSIQWRQEVDAWNSDAGKWCRVATVALGA